MVKCAVTSTNKMLLRYLSYTFKEYDVILKMITKGFLLNFIISSFFPPFLLFFLSFISFLFVWDRILLHTIDWSWTLPQNLLPQLPECYSMARCMHACTYARSRVQKSNAKVRGKCAPVGSPFYHTVLGHELKSSCLAARAFFFSLSHFDGPWARLILRAKHQMTCKR